MIRLYSKRLKRSIFIIIDEPLIINLNYRYPSYEIFGDVGNANTAQLESRYTDSSLLGVITDIQLLSHCSHLVCTFSSQVLYSISISSIYIIISICRYVEWAMNWLKRDKIWEETSSIHLMIFIIMEDNKVHFSYLLVKERHQLNALFSPWTNSDRESWSWEW